MTATPPAPASRGTNRSEVEGPAGSFLGHKLPMESPEIQRGGLRFGKILWPGRGALQIPPLRFASVGACDFFDLACSLWLESSEEHLPTSIAGVLRLRAISRPLCD
jgi:hypothetical protein